MDNQHEDKQKQKEYCFSVKKSKEHGRSHYSQIQWKKKKSCQNSRTLDNLVIQYPEASCTLIFKEIISSLWAIRREIIGSDLIFFIYFAQQLVKPLFELCMFVCQSRHGKICHDFVFSPIALLKPLQIDYKKKFNFSNTMKTRLKRDVVCVCCVARSFISQA